MNTTDWKHYLFSFEGRVGRAKFWLMVLLTTVVSCAGAGINARSSGDPSYGAGSLLELAMLWPNLAVSVKRWHDRDKSGWWVLINFVPVIGWIWSFIENGILRGTTGPNRFGADPLQAQPTTA